MNIQELKMGKMVFGGKCMAILPDGDEKGKKLLVSGALPDEIVDVEITNSYKDYDEGRVTKVIQPSPHRIEAKCPLFGLCGGCNLQFADEKYQQELRLEILKDAFSGVLPDGNLPEIQIISDKSWNYRNRFQFHKGGLMENKSNKSIQIKNCPAASEEINYFLADKNTLNNPVFKNASRYYVFGYDECLKGAVLEDKNEKTVVGKTKKKVKSGGKRNIYQGTCLNPESMMSITVKNKNITFDVKGFFQSNVKMLEKTIDLIMEDFGGENLLDMYSGVGTFSLFLSDHFNHTTLVEHNRDALALGEINLQGISHESFGLSGEKWVKEFSSRRNFDGVIIDPPRSGMEKSVCNWLCKSNVPVIKSLSCDPVTHGRDIKRLVESGYALKKLYLLDYYPQTSHIESLAVLEKV